MVCAERDCSCGPSVLETPLASLPQAEISQTSNMVVPSGFCKLRRKNIQRTVVAVIVFCELVVYVQLKLFYFD